LISGASVAHLYLTSKLGQRHPVNYKMLKNRGVKVNVYTRKGNRKEEGLKKIFDVSALFDNSSKEDFKSIAENKRPFQNLTLAEKRIPGEFSLHAIF
jgi:hypothetical protein